MKIFNKFELAMNLIYVFLKKSYYKLKYGNRVKFGKKVNFRKGFKLSITNLDARIEIGDNTFFNQYCSIVCMKKIIIGNDNLFGENCKIYDHNHIFNSKKIVRGESFKSRIVKIGNNNWFSNNCIVLSKSNVGNNNVFSAGAIVNESFDNDNLIEFQIQYKSTKIEYR